MLWHFHLPSPSLLPSLSTIIELSTPSMASTEGQVITCKGTLPSFFSSLDVSTDETYSLYFCYGSMTLNSVFRLRIDDTETLMFWCDWFVMGMLKLPSRMSQTSRWSSRMCKWLRRRPVRSESRFSSLLCATPTLTPGAARYSHSH